MHRGELKHLLRKIEAIDTWSPSKEKRRRHEEKTLRNHRAKELSTAAKPIKSAPDRALIRLWKRDRGVCHLCDCSVPSPSSPKSILRKENHRRPSVDHIIPKSIGGTRGLGISLAHQCCNSWRGNQPLTPEVKEEVKQRYWDYYFEEERTEIVVYEREEAVKKCT